MSTREEPDFVVEDELPLAKSQPCSALIPLYLLFHGLNVSVS